MKEDKDNTSMLVSIGKIDEDSQTSSMDTGWSEEEKERMRNFGYDDMDMIRAWYS